MGAQRSYRSQNAVMVSSVRANEVGALVGGGLPAAQPSTRHHGAPGRQSPGLHR